MVAPLDQKRFFLLGGATEVAPYGGCSRGRSCSWNGLLDGHVVLLAGAHGLLAGGGFASLFYGAVDGGELGLAPRVQLSGIGIQLSTSAGREHIALAGGELPLDGVHEADGQFGTLGVIADFGHGRFHGIQQVRTAYAHHLVMSAAHGIA